MTLEINSLTKTYGKIVGVDGITLRQESGLLGLLGPNGAGKTTLMRMLATLLDPTSGTASVEGLDVCRNRREVRRMLGYLPQHFGLYPQLTCREFLDFIGITYGMGGAQRKQAIEVTLAQVHLESLANRRIKTLSGGMKQRLGIAQAVLASPRLLIVDEPTVGLDPEERMRIRNLLGELARDRVVILSTHIVGDISTAAAAIALMNKGRVIFHGPPRLLLEEMHGRVWKVDLDETYLPELKAACHVTAINPGPHGLEARILCDDPAVLSCISGFEPAAVGLEDAYIAKMGSEAVGAAA